MELIGLDEHEKKKQEKRRFPSSTQHPKHETEKIIQNNNNVTVGKILKLSYQGRGSPRGARKELEKKTAHFEVHAK